MSFVLQRCCFIVTLLTVLLVGACAGDEPAVSRGACERMRDHAIELRLRGVVDDLDAHRAAARQVLGDGYVQRCVAETSVAELECSLAAKDLPSLHSCARTR
jgi:hypothetical protein